MEYQVVIVHKYSDKTIAFEILDEPFNPITDSFKIEDHPRHLKQLLTAMGDNDWQVVSDATILQGMIVFMRPAKGLQY